MKRFFLLAIMFCPGYFSFSQTSYTLTWGEEIKLKKGTADLDIVAADNSGLYFSESRLAMKATLLSGPPLVKALN